MTRAGMGQQAGFSLIELMVAVLLGLVLVMGTASFYSTLRMTSISASQLGAAQESLQAVNLIVGRATRQATSVTVLNNGKSLQVTYGNINATDHVLSCLGNVRVNNDVDTFIFEDHQLKCSDSSGNQKTAIALTLQNVTFSVSAGNSNMIQALVQPENLPASYGNGITLVFSLWQKYIQSRVSA